jgi:pimeloyl-ACP methyl ester carboxylesterase
MPKVAANGIKFHYWQVGQGDDVIMLHGLGGSQAVWHLRLLPQLWGGFRLTTYDLRGHGRTELTPTGYTTQDMADDLRALMDALGIERAQLVGHSLGGDIALHFALRYPERAAKIVAIEAGLPVLIDIYRRDDWEGWSYWAELIERFTGMTVPPERRRDIDYLLDLSLEVPVMYGPARGQPRQKGALLRLLQTTTVVRDYEHVGDLTVENLGKITQPILLVYEAKSPYMRSFDVLRERLPNCTPVILPDSELKHFSPLEQADVVAEHVKAFLESAGALRAIPATMYESVSVNGNRNRP